MYFEWRTIPTRVCRVVALAAALSFAGGTVVPAQVGVTLSGAVVDTQGLVLPGTTIELRLPDRTFVTSTYADRTGSFMLSSLAPRDYLIIATLQGFRTVERPVSLEADTSDLEIALEVGGFEQEIVVTAVMPEVATELVMTAREVERRAVRDVAAALREESGVNTVRRGPINLEPTIRGLFEAQIGMFVDGTRTFAAGPARMDSDISHVSPHMMQAVRVVKGPYALTWGSGTLSAIQVETFKPAFSGGAFVVGAQAGYTYSRNGDSNDGFAGLWGRSDGVRFTFLHNTRTGSDYEDGDGNVIPGNFESFETRWGLGLRPQPELTVEYSGGYQKQNDINYPGRLLDAGFFETQSHAFDVGFTPRSGRVSEVFGQVYANLKDHAMNNDSKPTAMDMPGRVPPFALDVNIDTTSDTVGGRFHVALDQGPLNYKAGFDVFHLAQNANRTVARQSNGFLIFSDIVWPDATVVNTGGYGQVVYDRGRARFGGTVRVDYEDVSAGEVSQFFRDNTTGELDQSDASVSAAVNTSVRATETIVLNLGLGRAVRQPTVMERYSDRFPATKFQIAAEFMGNPKLVAEESLEFNIGAVVRVLEATLEGDFFYRHIDNYITVLPDPSLPRRLPLSPLPVYRYINGDAARFTGYDVKAESPVGAYADLRAGWTYTWAEDTFFDEPLFGIAPFEQRYALNVHTPDRARWIELSVTNAAAQDRVAETRFEQPTDGWTRIDLLAGLAVAQGFTIKLGLENLTDEFYATHVNSLNPFTRERIAEIGRSFYFGAEYEF